MFRECAVAACLVLACGVALAAYSSQSIAETAVHRFRRQTPFLNSDASDGKCAVPGPVQNGRYFINPKRCPPEICVLAPGTLIPSGWDLVYECDLGYVLSSTATKFVCISGRWYPELPSCHECGSSKEVGSISPLISDGMNATVGTFPWHAGLYFLQEENGETSWIQRCGGSLISAQFVVTAAHCVVVGGRPRREEDVRIALGKYFRSWYQYEDSEQKFNAQKIIYQQNDYNPALLYFDIALVMLDKKVEFGKFVIPVCSGIPYETNYIVDKNLFVAGWGRTASGIESDFLQYTNVTFLPRKACEARIPSTYFLLEKLCTVKNDSTDSVVRPGDSGGGLTVIYQGRHYIVGIVSLNLNKVTLFTNITWSLHKVWMEKEMYGVTTVIEGSTIKPTEKLDQGTICSLSETTANGKNVCRGKVIFVETFSGKMDNTWAHHVYMHKFQSSASINLFVADKTHTSISNGSLILRPTVYDEAFVTSGTLKLEGCTQTGNCELTGTTDKPLPPVATASIDPYPKFYFRYGEVEIRAKLPVGDWLTSELHLVNMDNSYGPSVRSGFMVIVSRGNSDLQCKGTNYGLGRVELFIDLGPGTGRRMLLPLTGLTKDWYNQYHTFTVVWRPVLHITGCNGGECVVLR